MVLVGTTSSIHFLMKHVTVLSLEVLHTVLVIDKIPLHSLLRIDGGQISTI